GPQQSVVEIRQAVLRDRSAVNNIESNTDNPGIAGRQRNELTHDVPAIGEDFPVFVNTLHPQASDVVVAVGRIDGIVSSHHRRIEGEAPPNPAVGVSRKLCKPAAERVPHRSDLCWTGAIALVPFDMSDEAPDVVPNLIILVVDGKGAQYPVEI